MCNETTKKNSVDEVTSKTSNSLMKKTKAQLVEIILRKDEVERNLRDNIRKIECNFDNNIKKIEDECTKFKIKLQYAEKKYEILENDYENICDVYASKYQELKFKTNRYKIITYIQFICFLLLIILCLI